MFFRRVKPEVTTFEERLDTLRRSGFQIDRQPDGRVKVGKNGCAAMVADIPGPIPHIDRAGRMIGNDIALLVDGGFQKFWRVGDTRRAPALADQLKALHEFEEDLREALGLESLYNTSLGTTNDLHLYDRVEGRGISGLARPWDRKSRTRRPVPTVTEPLA